MSISLRRVNVKKLTISNQNTICNKRKGPKENRKSIISLVVRRLYTGIDVLTLLFMNEFLFKIN